MSRGDILENTVFMALEDLGEALRKSNQGHFGSIVKAHGLEKYEAIMLIGVAKNNEAPDSPGFGLLFNKEGGKTVIEGLAKKGLIAKDESSGKWNPTDAGMKILMELREARDNFRADVCSEFSEADLKELVVNLQKLRASVEKH